MNKRRGRLLCLVLLSLTLFSAMNAPTATAQPSQGDWIITAVEVAENETAPASIPATIKLVGQIGGPTQAVAAKENYVYVGVGLRLVVLDVSNPAVPREVGATRPLAGFVKDVAIANSTAYVVDGVGLWVVDVSNPAHPNEVGFYGTPGYAEGVTVAGRYAYVADGWAGFRVVDISDQAHPTEVGFAYTLGYAFDVAAVDDIAYIAGAGAGLRVVDISDPTHPTEIAFYDTPGYAYGIAVAGSTVYIADGWEGLRVMDVSDPANPTEIGFYDTPGQAFGLAIVSGTAYVADAFAGLRVVDISVPASPTEVGAYEVRGHAGQVVVAGGMVFVADRDWGLRVVDVSNPIHPAQVGFYGPLGYADGVAVAGDHAYVAAATYGMRVVNISDPSHPTEVGGYDTNSYATSVAVSGNYAYVATMPGQPGDGLHVVDVSDPTRPTSMGFYARTGVGAYRDMAVAGEIAYCANEMGLELISLADPAHPTRLGYIDNLHDFSSPAFPSCTVGVAVSDKLAYVAVEFAGLKIVDVSNPSNPSLVGVCDELHFSQDVAVAGDYAYVADYWGLRVVDVSDSTHPTVMGFYETPGYADGVAVTGATSFVADGGGGLSAVDVSNPSNPRLAASYNTLGYTQELVIVGNYAYLADGNGGLLLLEMMPNSGRVHNQSMSRFEILGESSGGITPFPAQFAASLNAAEFHLTHSETPEQDGSSADYQLGEHRSEASPVHHPNSPIELAGGSASPTSASTWTATSSADSGLGTLRWCLERAVSGDIITFDNSVFPPTSPITIHLTYPLPPITQGNLTIDASNAGVILDGSDLSAYSYGFIITSNSNVIKGLQILHFPHHGVDISGGAKNNVIKGNVISGNGRGGWGVGINVTGRGTMNNIIVGNFIGIDASGKEALGNQWAGVFIVDGASHNRVGGMDLTERNIISGNGDCGVSMIGAETTGNIIVGNYIGTDVSGAADLGNRFHGVGMELGAFNNFVERNLISGNGRYGVCISDWGTSYNTVIGNLIGTDVSGTLPIGNDGCGVFVGFMGASFNRIGGTTAQERNIISGNTSGVDLCDSGAVGNLVLGNFIGTDVTGTRALGNIEVGVRIGGTRFFVGGLTEGERNIISGNDGSGVELSGSGVWVAGNYIGTDANGTKALGNAYSGVEMSNSAAYNVIQGNLISGNLGDGVNIRTDASFNLLWTNRIGTAADGASSLLNKRAGLSIEASSNTTISNIIAYNRDYGIQIRDAGGNLVFHNDLINNRFQAADSGNNRWDYNGEGNYWSNYTGVDEDGDGIGDTPYHIHPNGTDNYPFMDRVAETPVFFRPVTAPRPARFTVTDLSISPTEVEAGKTVIVSGRVMNIGGQEGSYIVKLKIDDEVVDNKEVTLKAGESTAVDFTVIKEAGSYDVDVEGQTGTLVVISVVNIEPSGGSITYNNTRLEVPVNALSDNVAITVKAVSASPPSGYSIVGSAYELGPTGTMFAVPATITLSYDDVDLQAGWTEEELSIWRKTDGNWEDLGGTVDTEANKVSVETMSLNEYAIFYAEVPGEGAPPAEGIPTVYVVAGVVAIVAGIGLVFMLRKR